MKYLLAPFLILFLIINNSRAQKNEIIFATYTYDTITRIPNITPLAALLSKQLNIPVRAVNYPSVKALINGIRSGEADVAMMNTSGYLILQRNYSGIAEPLVNLDMNTGSTTNYAGCIITLKTSGIKTLQDIKSLKKKDSVAFVQISSTSGNLLPRLLLNSINIQFPDEKFSVYYAGSHSRVVDDILNAKAILGGCGCAELEKTPRNILFNEKAIVVASYSNIPLGPVVYNKKLDTELVNTIKTSLLKLNESDPVIFSNFLGGWTEFKAAKKFKPVTDADYDEFRKMFGNNEGLWKSIE